MGFKDFIGNQRVVEVIRRHLRNHRFPNSVLFSGIEGVGKSILALSVAKTLNCVLLSDNFCGHCSSCRRIAENAHPDVKSVEPDGLFIKIDQMREVSRDVFFQPFEGRKRVFIIDGAERLREEAANSILKTLEEPPDSSVLILITSRVDDLLPTILSRCQVYRFAPLPSSELEKFLEKKTEHTAESRALLSRISGGSLGKALTMDLDHYRAQREQNLGLLEACSDNFTYVAGTKAVSSWLDRRNAAEFEERGQLLCSLLRDVYLLKLDPAMPNITHLDLRHRLLRLASLFSHERLAAAALSFDHLEAGIRRNLNRSLGVDQLLFRLAGVV